MIKYYETLNILEGIYLENKKIFLKKDLSKYFKLNFYFDGKNILDLSEIKYFINGNEKNIKPLKSLHNFIAYILRKKEFNLQLDYYFYCSNENENYLNKREYFIFKKELKKLKVIIKRYHKIFINTIESKDIFDIDFIDDRAFTIKRFFDFELFFADHESLFDKDNDFENHENKKLYHGLKDKDGGFMNNLETEIRYLSDDYKFFIKINFDKSKINQKKYIISGEKKYDYVFILERGNYLVYNKKNG